MRELKYLLFASLLAFAPLAGCGSDDDPAIDEGTTDEGTTDEGTTDEGTTDGSPVSFCDAFAEVCGDISTIEDCATWWAAAAVGTEADTSGATQGCYAYHLGVAATDDDAAAIHCPHAAGEAVCVDEVPTVSFCDAFAEVCDGISTIEDCATWWAAAAEGTEADTSGATQGCYAYHLGVAATDDDAAAIHCPHAAGEAVCVDEGTTDEGTTDEGTTDEGTTDEGTTDEGTTDGEPATFCDGFAETCGDVMTCGADKDESCAMTDCATWWAAAAEGTEKDTAGATQGCYAYHLDAAATDADFHCPHAAGEAVCVD